jgi:hypothetical protein
LSRSIAHLGIAGLLLLPACHRAQTATSADQAVLDRRREGLARLMAAARRGSLLPFDKMLVVADQGLVRQVLAATLPFERVIVNRYRIRVSRADVHFEDGFGLVRLDGEASFADRAETEGHAEVTVFGGLDVVALDPQTGILRGSVKIIALDARRVNVYGVKSSIVEDLVEQLGREQLDSFSALASSIEIPVAARGQRHRPRGGPGRGAYRRRDDPRPRGRGRRQGLRRQALGLRGRLDRHRRLEPCARAREGEPVPGRRVAMKASLASRLLTAGLAAACLAAACRLRSGAEYFEGQRAAHERQRAEFAKIVATDPVVAEALAQGGDVILGIRPALVEDVLQEVAARYLDRVALDLPLEKQVHDSHELTVGTFLGKMNAGTWTLDVTIHRVRGLLRARPPSVKPGPDNTLAVNVPVVLQEGHGAATVHFTWDSRSLASVVLQGLRGHEAPRRRGDLERVPRSRAPSSSPPARRGCDWSRNSSSASSASRSA